MNKSLDSAAPSEVSFVIDKTGIEAAMLIAMALNMVTLPPSESFFFVFFFYF
jgi:hypothetical protein